MIIVRLRRQLLRSRNGFRKKNIYIYMLVAQSVKLYAILYTYLYLFLCVKIKIKLLLIFLFEIAKEYCYAVYLVRGGTVSFYKINIILYIDPKYLLTPCHISLLPIE